MIDLYDTEIVKAERIIDEMRERAGTRTIDRDAWTREVVEKFAAIGLKVDVQWWETNEPGVLAPDINIVDRLGKEAFDHERMAHEVQSDVLGFGEGGIIKAELPDERKKYF